MTFRKSTDWAPPGSLKEPVPAAVPDDSGDPGDCTGRRTIGVPRPIQTIMRLRTESVYRDDAVRTWMEKFPEVKRFERVRPLKRAIMLGGVAALVWSVYTGRPCKFSMAIGCAALSSLVAFDAFHMMGRILADYSRILITIALGAWAVAAAYPVKESIGTAVVVTMAAALCVRAFNVRWIAAQVYERSEIVRETMEDLEGIPMQKLFSSSVEEKLNTIMWEFGLSFNEIAKKSLQAAYLLGYKMASKISSATIVANNDLAAAKAQLEDELADLQEKVDDACEFFENYDDYVADYDEMSEELEKTRAALEAVTTEKRQHMAAAVKAERIIEAQEERITSLMGEAGRLQAELAAANARIKAQEAAAAEAEAAAEEDPPADIVRLDIETEDERAERMLHEAFFDLLMGVQRSSKHAGVTHRTAQTYYEKNRDAIAAAREAGRTKLAAAAEA